MRSKCVLAAGAALVVLALLPASLAVAGTRAPITVRVEGLNRTLLKPTDVKTHSGSLTMFGAPSGKCPDRSAAGALDAATNHRWNGTWESSFNDYEIKSILGETHSFSSKDFWEIFVNNVAAQTGACEITLKPGEQILFAAVPDKGPMRFPLLIEGIPPHATVGNSFKVRVLERNAHAFVPVGSAHVSGHGVRATTDRRGVASITPTKTGDLVLDATKSGLIRSAPVTVRVS